MGDQRARGEEFEKKAEKKIAGWGLFGSKFEDAAELYDKAANSYKLAKAWDKAGSVYIKLADCHQKLESKHEAASAYVDAGNCYKKISSQEAITCLNQAVNFFMEIGRLNMAARYCKEIGELYEVEENFEQAMDYFERSADLFQSEEVTTSANQCKQKVAQFAAQLEQDYGLVGSAICHYLRQFVMGNAEIKGLAIGSQQISSARRNEKEINSGLKSMED